MRVEVTATFGGDLYDVRTVRAGGTYRIGTAPGVDLPTTLATDFPLVVGHVVRVPVGIRARVADRAVAGEHRLVVGEPIAIELGRLAVRVELVPAAAGGLPRPPTDPRPPAYVGGSLVAHLAAWGMIVGLVAPAVAPAKRAAAIRVHAVTFKTRVEEVAKPVPAGPTAVPTVASSGERPLQRQMQQSSSEILGTGFAQLAAMGSHHVDFAKGFDDRPVYREDDSLAATTGFGGTTRKFDPKLAIAKTGRYQTVGDGRIAGDGYDLAGAPHVAVELCTGGTCVAVGGTKERVIRGVLADRLDAIGACYAQVGARGATTVAIDFSITTDGVVTRARGTGPVGACVASYVSTITFPSTLEPTRVHYPVGFRPTT